MTSTALCAGCALYLLVPCARFQADLQLRGQLSPDTALYTSGWSQFYCEPAVRDSR